MFIDGNHFMNGIWLWGVKARSAFNNPVDRCGKNT